MLFKTLIKNSFPTKFIDEQIQKKNNFESELIENTDEIKHYGTIPYVIKISETIEILQPNLNTQLVPDKGSRVNFNIFE